MPKYFAMAVILATILAFDLQYMKDRYVATASGNDVDGWIAGVRATCEF